MVAGLRDDVVWKAEVSGRGRRVKGSPSLGHRRFNPLDALHPQFQLENLRRQAVQPVLELVHLAGQRELLGEFGDPRLRGPGVEDGLRGDGAGRRDKPAGRGRGASGLGWAPAGQLRQRQGEQLFVNAPRGKPHLPAEELHQLRRVLGDEVVRPGGRVDAVKAPPAPQFAHDAVGAPVTGGEPQRSPRLLSRGGEGRIAAAAVRVQHGRGKPHQRGTGRLGLPTSSSPALAKFERWGGNRGLPAAQTRPSAQADYCTTERPATVLLSRPPSRPWPSFPSASWLARPLRQWPPAAR